jgi:hypothetical protein
VVSGTLEASDDASRAAWFRAGEIEGLKITEGTPGVIEKAFRWMKDSTQND